MKALRCSSPSIRGRLSVSISRHRERHELRASRGPVAMTTNCFPAFVRYVIGTEYALWPRSADHSVAPFCESIA